MRCALVASSQFSVNRLRAQLLSSRHNAYFVEPGLERCGSDPKQTLLEADGHPNHHSTKGASTTARKIPRNPLVCNHLAQIGAHQV